MSVGPANRRRDIRRALPKLTIRIDPLEFYTRDWSLGGFALAETGKTPLPCEVDEEVSGQFAIENRAGTFSFRARMVRFDEAAGVAGFRFLDMDPETFTVLERLMLRAQPTASSEPRLGAGGNWFSRLDGGRRR